ncbi:hypothetical protein [Chryseobacterium sp. AG363]|uniref:hypothetical protein n=1 Tax=Chryseobacterium sp. AG363 TaxID=2183997 RepID=UPI000E75055E|nr:hypothetical protein [Chryseobacterium sp. AG363]RKE81995.1 hypothetical protein DEU39_1545 [Chryseobacterium sp. AG363]
MKSLIFVFLSALLSAQISPARGKGEVFKHRPEIPYENTNYSGLVVVERSMYGLNFQDKQLSSEVKNRIDKFFKRHLNGYTELKTYQIRIQKKRGKWYVDNIEI